MDAALIVLLLHGDLDMVGFVVSKSQVKSHQPDGYRILERIPPDHFDGRPRSQSHVPNPPAEFSLSRNLFHRRLLINAHIAQTNGPASHVSS